MRIFAFISMILTLSFGAAQAGDEGFNAGLNVGEKVPANFSVVDQDGMAKGYDALAGEKGTVVFFVRSVDWCPYCQRQVIGVKDYAKQFEDLGYNVATISYDSVKNLNKFDKKREINFPMYSDPGSKMIDAFGLRNVEYKKGHYAEGVPYPTIYVIDRDGVIRSKFMEEGYKKRPEPSDVIAAIKEMSVGS